MKTGLAPNSSPKARLLTVCAVDVTAWQLLRPGLHALRRAGYDVHIACAPGEYCEGLAAEGFAVHPVTLRRTFIPWANLKALTELWSLIREQRFDIVSTHTPVAALVGRTAARLAGCRAIVYTVHGFYFDENTRPVLRYPMIALERAAGRFTHQFIFVSGEDQRTAAEYGIGRRDARGITLFNGVDTEAYSPKECDPAKGRLVRERLGIGAGVPVIGIVGRIVREKGYREFLDMAQRVVETRPAVFLVVGDTLPSDRDQFGRVFRASVEEAGMKDHFRFTGHTNQVADYLHAMDVFALPSYREGFPVSVLEAMSCGLPVVATRIRGCREAVMEGETGMLVRRRDAGDLFRAVDYLLNNPDKAAAMGRAGRARVVLEFDDRMVQQKLVGCMDQILATVQG